MPDEVTTTEDAREDAHERARPAAPPSDDVAAAVLDRFDGSVFEDSKGQPVVHVRREHWRELAEWLRDEQHFTQLVDVTAVDHLLNGARRVPEAVAPERFEVVANFLSHPRNRRLRAVCQVPASDPEVPSLTPVYAGADYAEREAFDMFGVRFVDHPDLTRILMPEDWEGWPLRKDDPSGRVPVQFKGIPRR